MDGINLGTAWTLSANKMLSSTYTQSMKAQQQHRRRTKRRHPPRPPFDLHQTWNSVVMQTITEIVDFLDFIILQNAIIDTPSAHWWSCCNT
jgi:hypothetical protein